MARAAREYALSQSWDAIMGGLRERYQRVIDERDRNAHGELGRALNCQGVVSVGASKSPRKRRA